MAVDFELPAQAEAEEEAEESAESFAARLQSAAVATRSLAADLTLQTLQHGTQKGPKSRPARDLAAAPATKAPTGWQANCIFSFFFILFLKITSLPAAVAVVAEEQAKVRAAQQQHQLRATRRENEGLHALNEVLVAKTAQGEQRAQTLASQLEAVKAQLSRAQQARAKLESSHAADQALYLEMCSRVARADQATAALDADNTRLSAMVATLERRLDEQHHEINSLAATKASLHDLHRQVSFFLFLSF